MTKYLSFSLLLLSLLFLPLKADDTQQLLSFKAAAAAAAAALTNWLPNQNPCYFTGVTCTRTRVSSIDLTNKPLSVDFRSVSSFLMTLPHLESLYLSNTNLTGAISSSSSCSSSLNTLDLSNNALSASLSDLSAFTTSCTAIKSLNLSKNSIADSDSTSTSTSTSTPTAVGLFKLNNLETLDLSFNRITSVASIVSNGCDKLKSFSMKSNNAIGNIPISNCNSLEYLDLSSNNFSLAIPSLGDCVSLRHIDLASNKFYGQIGAKSFSACHQLTFLNLSTNHFSGPLPSFPTSNKL